MQERVADSSTSLTLLNRIRLSPTDQAAWRVFVQRYGPKVHGWCRGWGMQDADAEDVTQDVLLRLAAKIRAFEYDATRSFRGWLHTLTHHAWFEACAARRRADVCGLDPENLAARDDLVRRLSDEFDHELLEQAMARVRQEVAPRTWDAFRLTALEGLPGAEAAERLAMKVATVFVHKSQVRRRLQDEIRRLEG